MPTPPPSAPLIRHTADAAQTREELAKLRPELVERYDAALPGARAAVLSRLLGALAREPLPGLRERRTGEVSFPGVTVRFPRPAATAFARVDDGLAATVRSETAPEDEWAGLTATGWAPPGAPGGPGPEPGAQWAATWHNSDAWVGELAPGAFLTDPGTLVRILWPGSDLAAEVDNSVANMALARASELARLSEAGRLGEAVLAGEAARWAEAEQRASGAGRWGEAEQWASGAGRSGEAAAARSAGRGGWPLAAAGGPDGLAIAEQSLTDGHPLHPCCRTRGGMSVADVLAYAPEHSPTIRLRRLRVPADRWHGTAEPVLLAHPWQADRIRDRYPWLADDGETPAVLPLMSLRTVARKGGGPHVKTAVDVRMTSAVRTVSPAAVANGPILSRLLTAVTKDLPIEVLEETAAGAVLVDGVPQRHLAHLVRQPPRLAAGETIVPLALYGANDALVAAVPDPYEMMVRLGTVLFAPLARVLERGVALEAHGQNTLVVLRDQRPVRIVYRDLGGVRVSARRLERAGFEAPRLRGDLPTDDPQVLRTKLAAAALGTVAAEIIAALGRHGADPQRLWGIVAAALRETGTTDVRHLLRDPLPVKATTAMRLAADPLDDIWAYLDNPLAAR
ncbi:IucA/IucC family protein [Paractinoplanes rhizophilus]|uniref:IucA/IucC family protein n=1 Tax=Paractinoplanes rhizophilus TaxID=1416877 RepID=A0ABW2HTV0_9ACTN